MTRKICIITPGYITSDPRVIKEADCLSRAGFDVRVVFSQGNIEYVRSFDQDVLRDKAWKSESIGWSPDKKDERLLYWKSRFRHYLARNSPPFLSKRVAAYAQSRVYQELAALAALEQADLYIGHYPAGLSCAALAALQWKARLGYDVEDLYCDEGPVNREGMRQRRLIRLIEQRHLPGCSYVSCVSELIAEEMVRRYSIKRPAVIHNVFPWAERASLDGKVMDRKPLGLSLYWFSQVIGCDRGLQDVIKAAGLLKENIQIHLRGYLSAENKHKLVRLAKDCGVMDALYFHAPVPPRELLSRASEHDVGLALEQPVDLSRTLTVSNKFFYYSLAGLAILATDVPGQKRFFSVCPDIGAVYPAGNWRSLAACIKSFITKPKRLAECRQASLCAARDKWNWEIESHTLIEAIERVFRSA